MTLKIESLKNKSLQLAERFKKINITSSFASFVLVTVLFPINLISTDVKLVEGKDNDFSTNVKLDTSSHAVLSDSSKISEIKPGESKIGREAREKAEVEAKAKIEAAKKNRDSVSRERRVYSDPSNFGEIYSQAEAQFGVDARLLRAVHQVETGGSGSTSRASYMGAQGPMQFLPSTFRRYGVDGNGDGVIDINNVNDAIFSAAKYLKACGYPDVKKALWGYNPSSSYYNKVMKYAHSYGM